MFCKSNKIGFPLDPPFNTLSTISVFPGECYARRGKYFSVSESCFAICSKEKKRKGNQKNEKNKVIAHSERDLPMFLVIFISIIKLLLFSYLNFKS